MLIAFFLVMARTTGLFMSAPLLSRAGVPRRARVLLVAAISGSLLAAIPSGSLLAAITASQLPPDAPAVAGAMVSEVAIGLAIGLLARMLVVSFQLAGEVIAFQMGFALASSFDPDSGQATPAIASIQLSLVTLVFLLLDGHHLLIRALAASFEAFPLGARIDFEPLGTSLMDGANAMYATGARVAAPVAGILLLINAMIGFVNRISPQLSIFNIGFPMAIIGGLIAILATLPSVASYFVYEHGELAARLVALLAGS
jgi:flagellar biosynthesis protein FliR